MHLAGGRQNIRGGYRMLGSKDNNCQIRVLHASPDGSAVDIFVDGQPAITGLTFGHISDYVELPSGQHNVQVFPAGTSGTGSPALGGGFTCAGDQRHTLAAIGKASSVKLESLDDTTTAPSSNMAKVRVFHTAPDAPAVDVVASNGSTLFSGVSFGEVTPFKEVSSNIIGVDIRGSGSSQVVLSVPDQTFESGYIYTLVAMGMVSGAPSFMVLPLKEKAQERERVRV
jgi:hypothetical protein